MHLPARWKFVLIWIVEQSVADREGAEFLVGQEVDRGEIESEAYFVGEVCGGSPAPGCGKKVFFVVVVIWRDGVVRVRQTQSETGRVHYVAVPGIRPAEGMVRSGIPIRPNAGIVTRFVITLVERIAARVEPISNT